MLPSIARHKGGMRKSFLSSLIECLQLRPQTPLDKDIHGLLLENVLIKVMEG